MQLLLLRHADATTLASADKDRDLSEKGREQARRVGRFCRKHHLLPEIIITSPFLRAAETARLVAEELDCNTAIEAFLTSGMTPSAAMEGLRAFLKFESVMAVGHEPDFSALAAALLGMPEPGEFHFRKATLVGIDVDKLRPAQGRLEFLIPVRLA